jgi:hypothetical protein
VIRTNFTVLAATSFLSTVICLCPAISRRIPGFVLSEPVAAETGIAVVLVLRALAGKINIGIATNCFRTNYLSVFRGISRGHAGRIAEAGQDGLGLNLALAQGSQIVGYGLFFVEANLAGVGADKAFVENAAGKLVKMFVFDGTQHARTDFRGGGDGVERDTTLLALFAQFFSKRTQDGLPAGVVEAYARIPMHTIIG